MRCVKSAIGLKSYDWSSVELLKDLLPSSITATEEDIAKRKGHFWHDMSSEYDSKYFLRYLLDRKDLALSDDFIEFVCLWHLDEQNHYRGLRRINSVLFDMEESDIDRKIGSREPSFDLINGFLIDEFTILLSIAFDEVTSTRAYKQDFSFFDTLGPQCLSIWIRNAARDEAAHYGNAMKLLRAHHSDRFVEAAGILDEIIKFETADGFGYNNTFIFDHDTDDFSGELLSYSKNTIISKLGADR